MSGGLVGGVCCVGTTGDRFLQRCESIEDKRTFSIVVYNIVARKGLRLQVARANVIITIKLYYGLNQNI